MKKKKPAICEGLDLKKWEIDCEEAFQMFDAKNKSFKTIPFRSIIFKAVWFTCIKFYFPNKKNKLWN